MYRATQKKLKGLVGMARMLWNDRIGEEKTVNGYTFTIVDVIDKKVEVRVSGKNFIVSRDVWNRGVFKNIMNELCPTTRQEKSNKAPRVSKYVGEEKMINDVLFRVEEYVKGKVKVIADGYEGVKEMAISTWKNAKFFKNIMKVLKRIVSYVEEKFDTKYELVIYNDFQRDLIGKITKECGERIDKEFMMCDTVAQVRKLFKHYAKYVHSDLGHDKIYDRPVFEWLVALRDTSIAMIELWFEDDED
jgi:hypothetical protein